MVYFDVLASILFHLLYLGESVRKITLHKLAEAQTCFFENFVDILETWPHTSQYLNRTKKLRKILKDRFRETPENVEVTKSSF